MANTGNESWGLSHPSAAFLLKCAKEKEKLRSKLRKELQEHMLYILEEGLYSNILLGINPGIQCLSEHKTAARPVSDCPRFLPAHKCILQVRTPAFLDYAKKNEENNHGIKSYRTYLTEAELQHFLRKAYTDDDIRRHECEALRLNRIYGDLFRDGKNLLNKHVLDTDEFERESLNSENFVTPKTSPITPEKLIRFPDMLHSNQVQNRNYNYEDSVKLNSNVHTKLLDKSDSLGKELKLNATIQDLSEDYDSELDNTHDEDNILGLKLSHYNSADISSTSVEIDESDFMMEDSCSPINGKEMSKSSESKAVNMQIDSEESPTTSGMVRSGTFDLQTQAPLEDYVDNNVVSGVDNLVSCVNNELDSSNNILESSEQSTVLNEGSGFFLHDPSQKLNLFKHVTVGDYQTNCSGSPSVPENPPSSLHIRRNDGSMTDSGFMSYSTISMLSDGGIPNSFSSSLIMSCDGNTSPGGIWKASEEAMQSSLEGSKKLSGSMFPFYIDINNLPEKCEKSRESRNQSPSVYMYIDANRPTVQKNHDLIETANRERGIERKSHFSQFSSSGERCRNVLTKAQSTPHLDACKENKSKRTRPRSCYMYIDLDSVEADKMEPPQDIKRAPSSISMFVDLNDDFKEINQSDVAKYTGAPEDLNFTDIVNKDLKDNEKAFGSAFEIAKNDVENQKRKLSDSFLQAQDYNLTRVNYCSLRRPGENMSDSALNRIANRESLISANFSANNNTFLIQKSKSMPRSPEIRHMYMQKKNLSSMQLPDAKLENDTYSNTIKIGDSNHYCDMKDLKVLLSEPLYCEKKRSQVDQDMNKKNEFQSEAGLLPMSPILRRKSQSKEALKPPPPPVTVKASTKPQDIDAMKFPRPVTEQILRETYNVLDNENILQKPTQNSIPAKKKLEITEVTKAHKDNTESSALSEKLHFDSTSRSESSAFTVSGETSSSGKLYFVEPFKDGVKSPLSFSLPYEFEDDAETVYSEVSDLSSSLGGMSGIASLERRWREGFNVVKEANATGLHNIYRMLEACSKLGEDLLRMFIEEIDTDVIIEAEGRKIKAHRCILSSRCKYFATILKEPLFADDGVISLEGFSYASVHFALCHIYSGVMNLPKDSNIIELALLADVLNLDTLVDVIILHLKTHYCHFFHRPCSQCIQGVLECLPLAVSCGFVSLREKCIRWLGKYFTRTWPNKVFAALPEELRELCFQSIVKSLAVETVIEMTLNCDRLMTTLPHVKWSEPVFGLVTRLLQECIHFMAKNFNRILCSEGFLVLGKGQSWNVSALEDDIMSAVELMTPDIACKSSVKLSQILSLVESGGYSEYGEFTQNFIDLLHKVNRHCERYLINNANKVVHCQSWACLAPEVQKKIKDAAVIVFEFEKPTAKPPRLSSLQRKLKKQKDGNDDGGFFGCFTYPKLVKSAKFRDGSSENVEKPPDHVQSDRDRKSEDWKIHDTNAKKIVSPITEESHCNGFDSRKEQLDIHDEDSLKEMQDLPHDFSQVSQNIYLDVSQQSSSAGLLETEENHSGTQCSDNPDSLDAHEEIMSDSKDDVDCSVLGEDMSHDEKAFSLNGSDPSSVNNANLSKKDDTVLTKTDKGDDASYYSKTNFSSRETRDTSHTSEKQIQRNVCDTSRSKKSPVKSFVPLLKSHNVPEKEPLSSDTSCKDLVAEIDADSRMVTHCLQEAEMLEQQLSRKLLHQQQVATTATKLFNSPSHSVSETRRSSRTVMNRVQKSLSSSQVKSMAAPVRGKSPGKLTPSPSSPHVPRLLRPAENPKDVKSGKRPPQSPKANVSSVQRSFRASDGNVVRQISPTKRLSTRPARSRSSNISVVRDSRGANPK